MDSNPDLDDYKSTERTATTATRRRVLRTGAATGALALGLTTVGTAGATGSPDFSPRIWGDGEQWGTKVTGVIKNPNEHSLDAFYVVTNSNNPDGQIPVSEAAPGNPAYNGGRWATKTVEWTQAGFDAHGTVPVLTRYGPADDPESILFHQALGHLTISDGSPPGGPPAYFRCPLLPVKD